MTRGSVPRNRAGDISDSRSKLESSFPQCMKRHPRTVHWYHGGFSSHSYAKKTLAHCISEMNSQWRWRRYVQSAREQCLPTRDKGLTNRRRKSEQGRNEDSSTPTDEKFCQRITQKCSNRASRKIDDGVGCREYPDVLVTFAIFVAKRNNVAKQFKRPCLVCGNNSALSLGVSRISEFESVVRADSARL